MYHLLLTLHSYLRWAVLVAALIVIARAFGGWLGKKPWTAADHRWSLIWLITTDLQLLLGLGLYMGVSPIVSAALKDMGSAMGDKVMRFWAVEHLSMMLLAIVVVHVARVLSRRAQTDAARHKRLAIGATLSLLLMLASIPWPFMPAGRALFR